MPAIEAIGSRFCGRADMHAGMLGLDCGALIDLVSFGQQLAGRTAKMLGRRPRRREEGGQGVGRTAKKFGMEKAKTLFSGQDDGMEQRMHHGDPSQLPPVEGGSSRDGGAVA